MISAESQGGPNIALITIICGWTLTGINVVAVSLLLWAKRTNKLKTRLDEYLTLLALATSFALVAQTTWAIVDEGMDNHEANISSTKFPLVVKSLLVNETLWGLVNTFVRLSAVLLIKNIFASYARNFMIDLLLVLSVLYGIVVFLEIFLICRPMAVDWDSHVDGTCGNQIASYLALEVVGLLLDFAILVVPMPRIWALSMASKKKLYLTIIFSIGILLFTITGLRLQALSMVNVQDFSYSKGYLGLLSALGASLGIAFCCIPYIPLIYNTLRKSPPGELPHEEEGRVGTSSETLKEASHPERLEAGDKVRPRMRDLNARWSMDNVDVDKISLHSGLRRCYTF
ncbi:hypothetical protein G7Y89_g1277 [Cudoniella acicularis]|uniref:Rhodopsin domain-containing protein n=1 Tax=Cudoniella acicularis TaxID=354080 RepID=A0A8H4W9P1_9HELO|nr:hypothetical protein G7Y89_g1277 [Cudoniella acicularis]